MDSIKKQGPTVSVSQLIQTLQLILENVKAMNLLISQNTGAMATEVREMIREVNKLPVDEIMRFLNMFQESHQQIGKDHKGFSQMAIILSEQHEKLEALLGVVADDDPELLECKETIKKNYKSAAFVLGVIANAIDRVIDNPKVHIRKDDVDFVLSELITAAYRSYSGKKKWVGAKMVLTWVLLAAGAGTVGLLVNILFKVLAKLAEIG